MPRPLLLMTILCAASLFGNAWLYRELKRKEAIAPTGVPSLSVVPSPVAETKLANLPIANTIDSSSKVTAKQAMEKCKKKFEDDLRNQFKDPVKRQMMKEQEIMALQAMNVGAETRLHLSEQTFSRILELQSEQDLSEREAAIGNPKPYSEPSVNPQIAEEFGEAIASKWADNQREYRGRVAVRAASNLFTDASVPLSAEQARRLVVVYSNAYQTQGTQDPLPRMQETEGGEDDQATTRTWMEKQFARQEDLDERIQTEAAPFLTQAQLELLRKKAELDSVHFRALFNAMPVTAPGLKKVDAAPVPAIEC